MLLPLEFRIACSFNVSPFYNNCSIQFKFFRVISGIRGRPHQWFIADNYKSDIITCMLSVAGFTFTNLIAGFIFSGIGLVAFVYGKKEGSFKPLSIGIALMAYPYFLTSTFWLYAVGIGLCLLLYFWRD